MPELVVLFAPYLKTVGYVQYPYTGFNFLYFVPKTLENRFN